MGNKKEVFARRAVVGFNVLYVIFGFILVIAASQYVDAEAEGTPLIKEAYNLYSARDIIVAVGISTIVVALFGFVGVFMKFKKALVFYVVSLFLLSMILIGSGIVMRAQKSEVIKTRWDDTTFASNVDREVFMKNFGCCGYYRVTDSYTLSRCHIDLNAGNNYQTPSCESAVTTWLEKEVYPLGRGCMTIGFIELLSLGISMVLIFTSKGVMDEFYENPFHG